MIPNTNNKKKILIIDDEEDLRVIVGYQFQAKGYTVAMAEDGLEGLQKLRETHPDLIILDLNMPRMGGIEFYQKICGSNGRPSHPVLVLTARANTRQLFLEFDVDGFMTKPFEIDDLIKEAEIIIEKSKREEKLKTTTDFKGVKNIFIVDHISDDLNKVSVCLLNAGYKVTTATGGTKAIEKMMIDTPEVALVNLGLVDIPGDIVVQRLMRMAKTRDIKFILYLKRDERHDKTILEGFSKKEGVVGCFEYSDVDELLKIVDQLLIEGKITNP